MFYSNSFPEFLLSLLIDWRFNSSCTSPTHRRNRSASGYSAPARLAGKASGTHLVRCKKPARLRLKSARWRRWTVIFPENPAIFLCQTTFFPQKTVIFRHEIVIFSKKTVLPRRKTAFFCRETAR